MQGRTQLHLLERETELTELQAVLDAAFAGGGRLAVVEGAAGAGKSALTAAAIERAAMAGLRVLTARGSELERDFARVARTSPERAAATIQKGIEAGRDRILVGPDARALALLSRAVPVRYFNVIKRLEPVVRRN